MRRCTKCGLPIRIDGQQRRAIRWFLKKYPWVLQMHVATLMHVSQARISEIVRKDKKRGGV